jgi:hypothetical protein
MIAVRAVGHLAALGLLLGIAGCSGTIAATGAARLESKLSSQQGEDHSALQVAPELTWRSRPGEWIAAARYAPTLSVEGSDSALVRHRATAEAGSGRQAGISPFGTALVEYGKIRPADLLTPGDGPLVPQPDTPTLESYALRGEAGVRGYLTRRSRLQLGLGMDRSGGLGTGVAQLPELTRIHASARGQHLISRRERIEAAAGLSHFRTADSRLLLEGESRLTRQVTERVAASIVAGGGAAHRREEADASGGLIVRPAGGAAIGYTAPGSAGLKVETSLLTRPEFDRLSGGLQQRFHGQLLLDKRLRRGTSANGRVRWVSDLAGETDLRRVVSLQAGLRSELPGDLIAELGGRLVLQDAQSPVAGGRSEEARIYLGVSRRLDTW